MAGVYDRPVKKAKLSSSAATSAKSIAKPTKGQVSVKRTSAPSNPNASLASARPSKARASHKAAVNVVTDDADDDKADALAALAAHSRMMLGFLGGDGSEEDGGANEEAESSAMAARRFLSGSGSDEGDEDEDGEGFSSDDGWGAGDGMVSDSEEEGMLGSGSLVNGKGKDKASKAAPVPAVVPEVVFADMGGADRRDDSMSKAERKAFMSGNSAKIMGIAPEHVVNSRKRPASSADDIEDAANSSLDATLHRMLLNNLLPANDLNNASRPVEKRNAMSGRLRELAQISLPGEGDKALPDSLHSRHSAKIRTGIIHAKAKRDEKARVASEAAGSWVRGAGGLGDIGKRGKGVGGVKGKDDRLSLGQTKKKKGMSSGSKERERGLNASFGRFEGGNLKVDANTIKRVERQSQKSGPVLPKGKGKGKKGW